MAQLFEQIIDFSHILKDTFRKTEMGVLDGEQGADIGKIGVKKSQIQGLVVGMDDEDQVWVKGV